MLNGGEMGEEQSIKSFLAETWEKVRAGRQSRRSRAESRRQVKDRRADIARRGVEPARPHDTGDDNHVTVPAVAVNKAAAAHELEAISRYIQGEVLIVSGRGAAGVSTYAQGARRSALMLSDEERHRLVAMHGYVNSRLPPDMIRMSRIVVAQVLNDGDGPPPTISEVGQIITQSSDERVQKGGVIGYYRALFQSIADLQREFLIAESMRRIRARGERG